MPESKRPTRSTSTTPPGSNPAGAFSPRTGSMIDPSWLEDPDDGRMTDTSIEIPPSACFKAEKTRAIVRLVTGINAGQIFTIENEAVVGRGREAQVRIEDGGVSRAHTKLVRLPNGKLRVVDLGSTNGTFVGGDRVVGFVEILPGEVVQIGANVILSFALVDEAEERLSRQLYESSTRDALTGAYNRKYLMQRLASEVAYANRHKSNLSALLFDLDHFKKVNDTHGHLAGDEVLRRVSASVGRMIRVEDVFGRYGGEEFIIIVRGIEGSNVKMFAERVRRCVEKLSMPFADATLTATISVGVAALDECGDVGTSEAVLLLADERLYRAKQTGRNRVCTDDTVG